MHDLKATCADRDSKKDHLGILKELSLSKTSNFEHDLSFSFDCFLFVFVFVFVLFCFFSFFFIRF